ncbi:MAG: glycosyltransferase family 9 protein, partial [Desulfovibrio sp.]|nr:glycosyltransferase family 9 protein [Desulfovibrio sp.]
MIDSVFRPGEKIFADMDRGSGGMRRPFRRILVVVNAPVGDVLMSTPAVRLLRKRYPEARITLFVPAVCAGLLQEKNFVDRVIPDARPEKKLPRLLWRIRQALSFRFARYDACFFLQEDPGEARYIKRFSGIPVRVCASHNPTGISNRAARHCTQVIPLDPARRRHLVDYYREIVGGEPLPADEEGLWIALEPDDAPETGRGRSGGSGRSLALCCRGSSRNRLNWPPLYWAELARRLAADGHSLRSFPPPPDVPYLEEICRLSGVEIDIRITTLAECAAGMRRSDLLVSVDTGQVHLAVALGVPVLSLAGSTTD